MAGRRDNDQSTFRITLEVDNDSALPKLLEGRVSTTLDFNTLCFVLINGMTFSHMLCLSQHHDRLLQY